MFCGVFVEDRKLYSIYGVYGDCNAILPFTSQKKSRLLLGYVCSYHNTNDLFQYQTEWFDIFFENAVRESVM